MNSKSLQTGFLLKGNSYNYKIERVLGQGSFGITYLASVKMEGALGSIDVNIKVAIKEFFMRDINGRSYATVTSGSKGGIYDDYRRKFAREALILSKLQHPNIIKVIEAFEANNTIYYVMEFIGGGSLDDYIAKNNGIKEDEAIKIVNQIGSALSFMHKNKMLHLDLKPSNIMMKESGDIVLIDFGLSKQYDPNGEPESSTKVGAGTPGYAPIEQANYREGKGFPITMDVYALGGTMFKMLTGVCPPEASDILNYGFPLYELQEHNISVKISGSVAKAMAPIKKNRFQSVVEFLQSFEDEITIIDTDVVTKKKVNEEINNPHLFIIKPQTKKVEISYHPFSPFWAGMYNAVIKRNGIKINDGIDKSASWSLSQKSFTKFLDSLRLLNFEVRDKINPEYVEASEEAAKLTIKLYDENNSIYATYWIGGWKNQFGNIIGVTESINDRLIDVIPNLREFLNHKDEKENKEKPAQKSKKEKSILQIRPDTSKVRIEYWPSRYLFTSQCNDAFITTVTPYEVNPNITQESTRELIPMNEGKFRSFLIALRALNLKIRDEVVKGIEITDSISPAKLRIKLYGKSEEVYSDIWIDDRGGGNIEGEVDFIEKQIIQIVPGLAKYLNGPFYEVPDILKELEFVHQSQNVNREKESGKQNGDENVTLKDSKETANVQNSKFSYVKKIVDKILFIATRLVLLFCLYCVFSCFYYNQKVLYDEDYSPSVTTTSPIFKELCGVKYMIFNLNEYVDQNRAILCNNDDGIGDIKDEDKLAIMKEQSLKLYRGKMFLIICEFVVSFFVLSFLRIFTEDED